MRRGVSLEGAAAANSLIFKFKISSQPRPGAGKQAVSHPDKLLDKEMGEKHDPFKSWSFDVRHFTEGFVVAHQPTRQPNREMALHLYSHLELKGD